MSHYQSFPDQNGDSKSYDKLIALRLPELNQKSFLDVGCNEGFFCGFAKFAGASRVVGIDIHEPIIKKATERFPACEFFAQSWDNLPGDNFDVIIMLSALHYSENQIETIKNLVDKLTPDGILVLEIGIVDSNEANFIEVKRAIDKRKFPTFPFLPILLKDYAWKIIGNSVNQAGDPVSRHVIHVSRKKPRAYLIIEPGFSGKSSIVRDLFLPAGLHVIVCDKLMSDIATGSVKVSNELFDVVSRDFSIFSLHLTYDNIFQSNLAHELFSIILNQGISSNSDFVVDCFVPIAHHSYVIEFFKNNGCLPIILKWDRPQPHPMEQDDLRNLARSYIESFSKNEQ